MRKIVWKKVAVLVAITLMGSTSITGCRIGKTELVFSSELSNKEVFSIDGETCSLSEAKVFLVNYQNLYGNAYGVDLWSHDFGEYTLEQYVKDVTVSQLAQIMSMNLLAKEREITLSEEELEHIKEASKVYYNSLSKEEKNYMDVDEEDIYELYQKYGLANKVYNTLTSEVSREVSDDDARVMEAYQIYVSDEVNANKVAATLKDGTDFLTLAGAYNEASKAQITFGRGDLAMEIEEVAFALENDEISGKITTENGFYFIKCINNYNQELTEANKQVILERRRREAFDDVYEEYIVTLPSEFNEEMWLDIELEQNDKITTKSFFETFEKYCNW